MSNLNENVATDSSQDVCFCCLSTDNLINLESSYQISGAMSYLEMYSTCFPCQFEMNNEYKNICRICVEKLKIVYEFKCVVERSRKYIMSWNKKSQNNCKVDSVLNNPETNKSIHKRRRKVTICKIPYTLDKTNLICEVCGKEFSFYKHLVEHMPLHYPNHICDKCGRIFSTSRTLAFHKKVHSDKRFQCQVCRKEFKTKRYLGVHHKVIHCGETIKYKCSSCGDVFISYNARLKHTIEAHGFEDKSYKCSQCNKRYRLSNQLSAHVRSKHLQEKKYPCPKCSDSFFTNRSLKKHLSRHTNEDHDASQPNHVS